MFETLSLEAFAHYIHGMTTMFFILWALIIYHSRHNNSMMKMMAMAVCYIAFGYTKDMVFLFTPWMKHPKVEEFVSLVDILCTPFVTGFFLEATRPGFVTPKRLLAGVLLFFLPIPAYLIFQSEHIVNATYALALLVSAMSFILIVRFAISYIQFAHNNGSYAQEINMKWVVGCAITFFAWMIMYYLCFNESTWSSEVIFDLFSISIWVMLWYATRSQYVIVEVLGTGNNTLYIQRIEKQTAENQANQAEAAKPTEKKRRSAKEAFLTHALDKKIEEKIYLNPKLTLNELAMTIGSNKSYLSEFLNSQGKSFYDYINEHRIAEACRILDAAKVGDRINMSHVATQSGFNSISSFNRYFYKIKEMPPTVYLRLRLMEAISTNQPEQEE